MGDACEGLEPESEASHSMSTDMIPPERTPLGPITPQQLHQQTNINAGCNRKGKGAAKNKVAPYKDGDIVGATAPKIEDGNKGRVMLMKMGWSAGTGLGADNNKGVLSPHAPVFKATRSGLR